MDSLDLIQIASEVLIDMVSRRMPSRETVESLRIARPDLSHITRIDEFACEIVKSELAKYKEKVGGEVEMVNFRPAIRTRSPHHR